MVMVMVNLEMTFPVVSEEEAIIDGSQGVPKTNKLVSLDGSQAVYLGDLEGRHDSGEMPSCAWDIWQDWFEDSALNDGPLKQRLGLVCFGKQMAYDIGGTGRCPKQGDVIGVSTEVTDVVVQPVHGLPLIT